MYKRPIPRPPRPPERVVPVPPYCFGTNAPFVPPPYVPVWEPKEIVEVEKKPERPFPEHVANVVQKNSPHRPPLKQLVDAMKLDGYSDEQIKKARDSYATMRRTAEKREKDFDKLFGKYSGKTSSKPVKKVLKILKKRS